MPPKQSAAAKNKKNRKTVATLKHDAKRKNIPTAEYQTMLEKAEQGPTQASYARRNRDLDPQLVWRGKDEQDWSDLVVQAPPLFIQEKVHPKVLIDDLVRQSRKAGETIPPQLNMFADFNGVPDSEAKTEFYQHDANWTNRMILGDSLQVMASLAEREGLRGQVQCIYIDPPYGIKFNSNFQWSTTSREVKDGDTTHITREPEQVKAFRDTWRDGIHSYLTYLRDRLAVARDLLTESGSVFVQIGDENMHRVRAVMDEVFGQDNCVSVIPFVKTTGQTSSELASVCDYLLWYSRSHGQVKNRRLFRLKEVGGYGTEEYRAVEFPTGFRRAMTQAERSNPSLLPDDARTFRLDNLVSQGFRTFTSVPFTFEGQTYDPGSSMNWKTTLDGLRARG